MAALLKKLDYFKTKCICKTWEFIFETFFFLIGGSKKEK